MGIFKKKRLFFDIETSPNIGFFWSSGYRINVPYQNIIRERAIICISYKWADEDKVYHLSWDDKQDDKALLEAFIPIANKAAELVGHNGDKFDLPWVRTRCLFHGIPCFPSYTSIDTLTQARSNFRFNSNRLDYIAQYLGLGEKMETGFDLWKDIVLKDDRKALEKMVKYCDNDVILLEKIYNRLSNYIPHKTHYGMVNGEGKGTCPECGSSHLTYIQTRYTALGTARVQLQCKDCKKYHTVSERTYELVSKD